MLTWEELEQAAPEIAARGREFIGRFQFVLAERAAWITYDGDGQTSIRWRLGEDGEKRLYRPGI